MTSPSRRKHPTTAQNTPARNTPSQRRLWLLSTFLSAAWLSPFAAHEAQAQNTGWSPQPFQAPNQTQRLSDAPPSRELAPTSNTQRITQSTAIPAASASQPASHQANAVEKPGVVLRWRKSSLSRLPEQELLANNSSPAPSSAASNPRTMAAANGSAIQRAGGTEAFQQPSRVRTISYQPPAGQDQFAPLPDRNRNRLETPDNLVPPPQQNFQLQNPPQLGEPNSPWKQDPNVPMDNDALSQPMTDDPRSLSQESLSQEEAAPNQEERDDAPSPPELNNPFPKNDQKRMQDDKAMEADLNSARSSAEKFQLSCDQIRDRALADDISSVSLNVSPEYGVGQADPKLAEIKRLEFVKRAPIRAWRDYDGKLLVDAKLVNVLREEAILETASGSQVRYRLNFLSDPDLAYIAEQWQFPITCSLRGLKSVPRNFMTTTAQWKASGLCHKPLLFEDVQLERYGHEIGPVMQPIASTAHFFGNIFVMPYKSGIHPPNECQYALGYYRPGNCAPWTVGPIPISLRGGLSQAAAVAGVNFALP